MGFFAHLLIGSDEVEGNKSSLSSEFTMSEFNKHEPAADSNYAFEIANLLMGQYGLFVQS